MFGASERRGERAERSEKKDTSTIKMRGIKDANVRSQNGGMVPNMFSPCERRGKSAESSEKKETITIKMRGMKDAKGRAQRDARRER